MPMDQFVLRDPAPTPQFELGPPGAKTRQLVLYSDAFVVHGTLQTPARRLSDALNVDGEPFLVLEDVSFEEHRSGRLLERAAYAQVNLSTILFAYEPGDRLSTPFELRTIKVPQPALISLPPFRVVGEIHLLPERHLRDALQELLGRFVPLTGATFWSEPLGIARTSVSMIAFNHARSQILAPYGGDPAPPDGAAAEG
jgi:hypothetical protein